MSNDKAQQLCTIFSSTKGIELHIKWSPISYRPATHSIRKFVRGIRSRLCIYCNVALIVGFKLFFGTIQKCSLLIFILFCIFFIFNLWICHGIRATHINLIALLWSISCLFQSLSLSLSRSLDLSRSLSRSLCTNLMLPL